jgi:hypothetical protein
MELSYDFLDQNEEVIRNRVNLKFTTGRLLILHFGKSVKQRTGNMRDLPPGLSLAYGKKGDSRQELSWKRFPVIGFTLPAEGTKEQTIDLQFPFFTWNCSRL